MLRAEMCPLPGHSRHLAEGCCSGQLHLGDGVGLRPDWAPRSQTLQLSLQLHVQASAFFPLPLLPGPFHPPSSTPPTPSPDLYPKLNIHVPNSSPLLSIQMFLQSYTYNLQGAPFTQTWTSPFSNPAFAATSRSAGPDTAHPPMVPMSAEPKLKA